jgi:predicted small integral membrane protein
MEWMAWTGPTIAFFCSIGVALVVMTVWELRSPTQSEQGFLPISTTRGDRFFISLLSAAFIHLFWLGVVGEYVWFASLLAVAWAWILMRWG